VDAKVYIIHLQVYAHNHATRRRIIHSPLLSLAAHGLLASLDGVVDRLVLLSRNLGLEVDVHQLALVGGPLAVRVPVEHNLVAAGISDLGGRMAQRAVGAPLDLVARRLGDEEGLGAALVAVVVKAFLDVVVEDRAVRDGLLCGSAGVGYGWVALRGDGGERPWRRG